jgi:CRISPR-associated protein Cmr3
MAGRTSESGMATMFRFLIKIQPLGLMYGSAGAFLSPENLVGRSGAKFPPDAPTLSGLFFSTNNDKSFITHEELRDKLHIAGPFWAMADSPEYFYVPMPRHKVIQPETTDEWLINSSRKWCLKSKDGNADTDQEEPPKTVESEYRWLKIDYWDDEPEDIWQARSAKPPSVAEQSWEYVSMLHPQMQKEQRCVLPEKGLFLENAVQMHDETCLVYLSTYALPDGWYQFGGEGHMVEVSSIRLEDDSPILERLRTPIRKTFALITPAVWGSHQFSHRYPKYPDFAQDYNRIRMLTDKAVPYRYRMGYRDQTKENHPRVTRLSRGRYAVPAGSVYVLKKALDKSWNDFPEAWFPEKGLLKKFGCGLCLPIKVQGVDD